MESIEKEIAALPAEVHELARRLAAASPEVDLSGHWPQNQMKWCGEAGVYRWFIPEAHGGYGWSEDKLLAGYLLLSQSCLTTTFILTQWVAACRRLVGSENAELKERLLPGLADGSRFATVGISHLTTSRQHLSKPVLVASPGNNGSFRLNGFTPWVTSAPNSDLYVIGAAVEDSDQQLICAVPSSRLGLQPGVGAALVALTGSCTDRIDFEQVEVQADEVVAGPIENVMQTNSGGGAGGLQTSTLAVGLSLAAVTFIAQQAENREYLQPIADKMGKDVQTLQQTLVDLTEGRRSAMTAAELRQHSNSLVLRATQAALSAAKGAGFLATHPTGRWAREALFFLVWSCPQPVVDANLCELAQIN